MFPALRRVEVIEQAPGRSADIPDPNELRTRAFTAIRELIGRLSDLRPVVIFIDDLQWGDADTSALVTSLLEPLDAPPLLLLGSHRSDDASDVVLVRALQRVEGVEGSRIDVRPIPDDAAEDIARGLMASASPDVVRAVVREAGGNPFFLCELARSAAAGGDSTLPSLALALSRRVRALPDEEIRLLEAVVVAGRPTPQPLIVQVAGARASAGRYAVLQSEHLVRTRTFRGHDCVEPYHDRIREILVSDLSESKRRALHRGLAIALEAYTPVDHEAVTEHLVALDDWTKVAEYAEAAGDAANAALAFERAAYFYQLALRAPEPARIGGVEAKLGNALADAGHGRTATEALVRAARHHDGLDALELETRAVTEMLWAGDMARAVPILRRIARSLGVRVPRSRIVMQLLLVWSLFLVWWLHRRMRIRSDVQLSRYERLGNELLESAAVACLAHDALLYAVLGTQAALRWLRQGERNGVAMTHAGLAIFAYQRGQEAGIDRRLADAWAAGPTDPAVIGRISLVEGGVCYGRMEYDRALDLYRRADDIFATRCARVERDRALARQFMLLVRIELWDAREIQRLLPMIEQSIARTGKIDLVGLEARARILLSLAIHDDLHAARAQLAAFSEDFSDAGGWRRASESVNLEQAMVASRFTIEMLSDNPDGALEALSAARDFVRRSGTSDWRYLDPMLRGIAAAASARRRNGPEAARMLRVAEVSARKLLALRSKARSAGEMVLRAAIVEAAVAVARGEAKLSRDRLERLLELLSGSGRAGARSALGAAVRLHLANLASAAESDRLREEALGIFRQLGIRNPERVARFWGLGA
jgi:eukaryotic-like serine/threonine-protein kinase